MQENTQFIVSTKSGMVDQEEVEKHRQVHKEQQEEIMRQKEQQRAALGGPSDGSEGAYDATVNAITANQTQEYFAIATDKGFEIIQNDSGSSKLKKKVQLCKAVSLVEMMYKTNIIVLVFEQQRNKVVIWDDHEKKKRTEITFNKNQTINNVKLRKDMMVVVLSEKAFIFNFVSLKLIEQVETFPNPLGLVALSAAEKPASKIICLPSTEKGQLKVLNYVVDKSIDLAIMAHDNTEIGAIAVNNDGTLIASASVRGHIIKIFSTDGGDLVQELKRGNSKADISGIVFHPTQHIIACTSSNKSIHLFEISKAIDKCIQLRQYGFTNKDLAKNVEAKNSKSGMSWMKVLNKYWDSDLCLSKIKLDCDSKTVGFDAKNNRLTVVSNDRSIFFVDIPGEQTRYIESAEVRFF